MHTQLNNVRLVYTDQGQGQPVLLIHGFPLSRQMWEPQVEALSSQARILAPDLPGHGETEAADEAQLSMEGAARLLAGFLDALDVRQPVVVCGLSMGGYIALAFYRLFPERTAGLVLTATRSGADSEEARGKRDQAREKARTAGVEAVVDDMLPKLMAPVTYQSRPELVEGVRAMMAGTSQGGMMGALRGMKERPDSTPLLAEVRVPTLIIHGEDDQLIPADEGRSMSNHLPHGRLALIPQAGHLLNLEQPQAFNQLFATFLDEIQPT
jgi:3-oxoadipate enol-lactonase